MTGQLTLWGANRLLGMSFGKLYPVPDNYYLALIRNTAPTAFVSGQEIDEPVDGGYFRAVMPNNSLVWTTTGAMQVITTASDIEFAEAISAWGTIRYWALCSELSGGFLYAIGRLDSSIDVAIGDIAVLGDGDLTIQLGPFYAES